MRVYFKDFLDVGAWILTLRRQHLTLLDFLHEGTLAITISHHHARFCRKSIGDNNIADLLEECLFGVFNIGLVHLSNVLLLLSFSLVVVRKLEVPLAHIDDILVFVLSESVEYIFVNGVVTE